MDQQNQSSKTALMLASQLGEVQIMLYLLENHCSINIRDKYKNTALHYASLSNNLKSVQILLKNPKINASIKNFEAK